MFVVMEFNHVIHVIRMASGSGPVARLKNAGHRTQDAGGNRILLRGASSLTRATRQSRTTRSFPMKSPLPNSSPPLRGGD